MANDAASERQRAAPSRFSGAMAGADPALGVAANYRRFGEVETAVKAPQYAALALAVADDPLLVDFLTHQPLRCQQPNLLFSGARLMLGHPPTHSDLVRLVTEECSALEAVLASHRTQTNEPNRCAIFLPALCQIPEPLAIVEVGASAGLTLLVDAYSYEYGGRIVRGRDPLAPLLSCRLNDHCPVPEQVPRITWRCGIDLAPLDPASPDDALWLSSLLWPGQAERLVRLAGAIAAARRHRPTVLRADLRRDLRRVAEQAPKAATLVVYHSAVLAYVEPEGRAAFAEEVGKLGAVWLSYEGVGVVDAAGGEAIDPSRFALVRDGRELLASGDPHGSFLDWLD